MINQCTLNFRKKLLQCLFGHTVLFESLFVFFLSDSTLKENCPTHRGFPEFISFSFILLPPSFSPLHLNTWCPSHICNCVSQQSFTYLHEANFDFVLKNDWVSLLDFYLHLMHFLMLLFAGLNVRATACYSDGRPYLEDACVCCCEGKQFRQKVKHLF